MGPEVTSAPFLASLDHQLVFVCEIIAKTADRGTIYHVRNFGC
jgi:hypothetical protein